MMIPVQTILQPRTCSTEIVSIHKKIIEFQNGQFQQHRRDIHREYDAIIAIQYGGIDIASLLMMRIEPDGLLSKVFLGRSVQSVIRTEPMPELHTHIAQEFEVPP